MAFTEGEKDESQKDKILDHLINVGSISFVEANDLYRCRSLTRHR